MRDNGWCAGQWTTAISHSIWKTFWTMSCVTRSSGLPFYVDGLVVNSHNVM
ncbi:hypothetical protein ABGV43_29260 [Paenibacillus amylolyticus]|uniref:hypothetical protein n=1 Tax=Paenibacillus amylolyticus TaxID=1451 RepID=UPI0032594897